MPDERLTGPWLLALGALAVGVGAVVAAARRGLNDDPGQRGPEDEAH